MIRPTRAPVPIRIALLALTCAAGAFGQVPSTNVDWFASDRFGTVGEPIDESQRDAVRYTVRVEQRRGSEIVTLFDGDEPIERTEFDYDQGLLIRRRTFRGDELITSERIRYWRDGSLRSVTVSGAEERSAEYHYRDGRLVAEWLLDGEVRERIVYDDAGRVAERSRFVSGERLEHETYEYWGDLADDPLRRVVRIADGVETIERYDETGRLLGTSVARAGELERERTRLFEDGLLVEERESRGGVERVWRYDYVDAELVEERYYEDGRIVHRIDFTHPDYTRLETIYRDGEPVLRVAWVGEERVLEEVLRDGEVIRTRRFERDPAPADATGAPGGAP